MKNEDRNRATETETDQSPNEQVLPEGIDRAELRRVNGMSRLFDFVEMLVLTVVVVLLISTFFIRHTLVEGDSMNNTLISGQHLLISDVNYTPEQGDIVVFIPLNVGNRTIPYIKRVIAVGGETVEIKSGEVYVNGRRLDEEYLTLPKGKSTFEETTVPEGYVFVLGDNREHSHDSREDVGFVDVRSILGKVVCRVWPFDKVGKVE